MRGIVILHDTVEVSLHICRMNTNVGVAVAISKRLLLLLAALR